MALLRAYFDESGTHGDARVTGVAGFIGPAEEWTQLEDKWQEELARFAKDTGHDIKDFHAYECENGQEYWFGIDRSIREAYYQRLARVLVQYNKIMGVSFSIENDQWNAYASPEFKDRYRSPYQLCAESCFQQVASYSTNRAAGSTVALVFAEHPTYSKNIEEVFSYYMSNKVWSNIKSFTTSSPKDCTPLQSADMMSYESYRYWDEIGGKRNMGNMTDRPAWKILADAGHFQSSACYGGLGLMNAVRRFHFNEKLGLPYPSGH
jgi:hypothetical protein